MRKSASDWLLHRGVVEAPVRNWFTHRTSIRRVLVPALIPTHTRNEMAKQWRTRRVRVGVRLFAMVFVVFAPCRPDPRGDAEPTATSAPHQVGRADNPIMQSQSSVEDLMAEESPTKVVCVRIAGPEKVVRVLLTKRPMDIGSLKRDGDRVILQVFVPERIVGELNG